MAGKFKKWRESATLILIAKQALLKTERINLPSTNYQVLTLKRSSKSSFMPDTQVFPGGTLDKADCSQDWLNLYKNLGIAEKHFNIFEKVKYKAPIFQNENSNNIPKYISLRICAIREAFEECGILLCRKSKQENNGSLCLSASNFVDFETEKWQKEIHNDASKFIELCSKYEIYPDIWALHEWSNWLTPVALPKRFDTIFFLANVGSALITLAEKNEVQSIQWESPEELLRKNHKSDLFLPPPQFYELSRMLRFPACEELAKFSANRSMLGTERFLPYRLHTDKIEVTILPGDDMYPGEEKAEQPNNDVMDNIPEKTAVHRMYHIDGFKSKISLRNCKYKIEHVYPIIIDNIENSKL